MKFLLLTALLIILAPGAKADIYAYTDANGVIHFSNMRANKDDRLVVSAEHGESGPGPSDGQIHARQAGKNRFTTLVEDAARIYKVDVALLHAVISAESGYNPTAVSHKGAVGLMQLMPETARRYGVENSFDPVQNIRGGTKYLSYLLQLFDNDIELALAAYNAGENTVIRHGNNVPPFRETLGYVSKVMKLKKIYRPTM